MNPTHSDGRHGLTPKTLLSLTRVAMQRHRQGQQGQQGHTRPRPNPYPDPKLGPNPKLNPNSKPYP